MTAAPIIVTATFGDPDFAWLDALRKAHFPPALNRVPAHLTLFHHLPPTAAPELRARLATLCRAPPPEAHLVAVSNLGRGVAFRVASPALEESRAALAEAFDGLLVPQDRAAWRPHVTIQNKVDPATARALFDELDGGFLRRPLRIKGLASWWYRGGPWEPLSQHSFSRAGPAPRR